MNTLLSNQEKNLYILQCKEKFDFQYTTTDGSGWSRSTESHTGTFVEDIKYTFSLEDEKISENVIHCKELNLTFKKQFILKLLEDNILIMI